MGDRAVEQPPPLEAALLLLSRLTRGRIRIARERRYVLRDLLGPPLVAPEVVVAFDFAPEARVDEYLRLGEDTPEKLSRRLQRGDRLFVGEVESELRFFGWLHLHEHPGSSPTVRTALIYKCFTAPEWRGRGLYTAGLCSARQWLAKAGVAAAVIDVHERNLPSIRGIERSGFRAFGRFWLARICRRRIAVLMPRYLHEYGPSL